MDVKEITFVSEWIVRGEFEERAPDRVRILGGDLLADEVLRRGQIGPRSGVGDQQALADGIREHFAQWDDDVAHSARSLAVGLELGDEAVDVLGSQRGERPLAEPRQHVPTEVEAVALEGRGSEPRPPDAANASGVAVRQPPFGVGGERLAARLSPRPRIDLALPCRKRALGFAATGADCFPLLLAVDVVDDRVVAARAL